jgi:hypothetical protein
VTEDRATRASQGRTALRDQIAEALYRHTMDAAAGGPARLLTRDETVLWENSLARADAVLHVVEAETETLRVDVEELRQQRDYLSGELVKLTERLRGLPVEQRQRAEEAERQRDTAHRMMERFPDVHMRFGVVGVVEPEDAACADWCYACRLNRAERQRDEALAAVQRVRDLAHDMRNITGARAWAERLDAALDQPEETPR